MHREILQGEGRIVHSSKDGADPGLQQLDVEVCNGTGILPRIDEPGQAVIFVRELSQITGGSDEGVTIDQGQPQERQQGEQRPPGPHQIGPPCQHQQDTDDGQPVAHRAQAQSALSLPPLHALQSGIGAPGHGFHLRRGATADRLVAIDPPLLEDRGDIGIHPIVTPILAAVFHHAAPGFALLELAPEVSKGSLGHVRVANHVVVLADELSPAVPRYPAEVIIGVGDHTLQVRSGDQLFIGRKIHLFVDEMNLAFLHGAHPLFDHPLSVAKRLRASNAETQSGRMAETQFASCLTPRKIMTPKDQVWPKNTRHFPRFTSLPHDASHQKMVPTSLCYWCYQGPVRGEHT